MTVYIGLGSNLGDGPARLRNALAAIDRLPRTVVRRRSAMYKSLPMGRISQPAFTNAVAEIATRLGPNALLGELHKIERRFARVRKLRWGPRTLDLDILVYGDTVLERPELMVPHPGIPFRAFVLYPLREIAPGLRIPGMGTPDALIHARHLDPPGRLHSRAAKKASR